MAQHRWLSLGAHLDRVVHPHPRPPSHYPGQVRRRRVPASGAVSITVYALAHEAFSPPLTPRTLHSMRYKAVGGTPPSRIGPVFTIFGRCRTVIVGRRRRTSPPMPVSPTSSEDCPSCSTTNAWIDQKVEEGTAVVEPACKEPATPPSTAPHGEYPPAWAGVNRSADPPVKLELRLPTTTSTRTGCVGIARLPALSYDSWDASSYHDEPVCPKSP